MNVEELLEQIIAALREITFNQDISEATKIRDLGMDSLDFLELFFRLQSILSIEMSQRDLEKMMAEGLKEKMGDEYEFNSLNFLQAFGALSIRELSLLLIDSYQKGNFTARDSIKISEVVLEIYGSLQDEFVNHRQNARLTPAESEAMQIWNRKWGSVDFTIQGLKLKNLMCQHHNLRFKAS